MKCIPIVFKSAPEVGSKYNVWTITRISAGKVFGVSDYAKTPIEYPFGVLAHSAK